MLGKDEVKSDDVEFKVEVNLYILVSSKPCFAVPRN